MLDLRRSWRTFGDLTGGLRLDWRENLRLSGLAALVGTAAGFVAILFRYLIVTIQNVSLFGGLSLEGTSPLDHTRGVWIGLMPAAGGLVAGLLTHFFAREARGHGVPEVMEAIALREGRVRSRVIAVKSLASAVTIGTGGSAGREGPIVQIGSSAGSTLADMFHLAPYMRRVLVGCGAAGGIAATFNTPIAGVLFSIEIILLEFKTRSFVPLVIASVFATIVSRFFLGRRPAFDVPPYGFEQPVEIFFYLVLGVVSALVAVAFIIMLYKAEDLFARLPLPRFLTPVAGGLVVGAVAIVFPHVLGTGYETVSGVLHEQYGIGLLGMLVLLKVLAVSCTLGSGGSGGVFAPSLFIGAALGGAFGGIVHALLPSLTATAGAYALVGMAAVFAGASRATLTSIIILFELTQDYRIILPLMFACVVSDLVAWTLSPDSIYTKKLTRRGVRVVQDLEVDVLTRIRVRDVMERQVDAIPADASVREAYDRTLSTGNKALAVVDEHGALIGIVSHFDLSVAFGQQAADRPVGEFATSQPITAFPDQPLHDVIAHFSSVRQLPVVDRAEPTRVIGMLTRADLVRAREAGG